MDPIDSPHNRHQAGADPQPEHLPAQSHEHPDSLDVPDPSQPSSDEPPPAHSREASGEALRSGMQSPNLPELPKHELDFSFDSIINSKSDFASDPEFARVQKRASNVLKLSEENEKLNAELKAMTERLEAAEKKRKELEERRKNGGSSGNTSS